MNRRNHWGWMVFLGFLLTSCGAIFLYRSTATADEEPVRSSVANPNANVTLGVLVKGQLQDARVRITRSMDEDVFTLELESSLAPEEIATLGPGTHPGPEAWVVAWNYSGTSQPMEIEAALPSSWTDFHGYAEVLAQGEDAERLVSVGCGSEESPCIGYALKLVGADTIINDAGGVIASGRWTSFRLPGLTTSESGGAERFSAIPQITPYMGDRPQSIDTGNHVYEGAVLPQDPSSWTIEYSMKLESRHRIISATTSAVEPPSIQRELILTHPGNEDAPSPLFVHVWDSRAAPTVQLQGVIGGLLIGLGSAVMTEPFLLWYAFAAEDLRQSGPASRPTSRLELVRRRIRTARINRRTRLRPNPAERRKEPEP